MNLDELNKVARAMVAPGKGILAADESTGTIKKRFDAIGTENTEDNRRDYREMMFRTAEAMKNHISGVILYDETIWQKAKDGTPLVDIIKRPARSPASRSTKAPSRCRTSPAKSITIGLDKLADRLPKYYDAGRALREMARGDRYRQGHARTQRLLHANAHALARYAALCQAAQIVPIVEPEVLMDGDHDIDAVRRRSPSGC